MLNKAICTKARVQIKKRKTIGERKESITCVHQTFFPVFFIIPHQKMFSSSAVSGDREMLMKLLWTNLFHSLYASLKPNIHSLGTSSTHACFLSKNRHKFEKSTFVIVISSSMNRAQVDTDGCSLLYYNPAEKPDHCFWLLLQMQPVA